MNPDNISNLLSAIQGLTNAFNTFANTSQSQRMASIAGNNLGDLISQMVMGRPFNPQQDYTMASIINILGQSRIGGMLGMDNPLVGQQAARGMASYYYGALQSRDPILQQQANTAMMNAVDYIRSSNTSMFNLSTANAQELSYLLRGGINKNEWAEFNANAGNQKAQDATKVGQIFTKARETISIAQQVLGMGDDLSQIINTANAIGGSADQRVNFDRFNAMLGRMASAGLNQQQMQAMVQQNIAISDRYQRLGYGSGVASEIARQSSNIAMGYMRMMRDTGANVIGMSNLTELANLEAEKAALNLEEMGNHAIVGYLAASNIKDPAKKKEYLEKLKGIKPGDRSGFEALADAYGIGEKYRGYHTTAQGYSISQLSGMIYDEESKNALMKAIGENTHAKDTKDAIKAIEDSGFDEGTKNKLLALFPKLVSGEVSAASLDVTTKEQFALAGLGKRIQLMSARGMQSKSGNIPGDEAAIALMQRGLYTPGGIMFGDETNTFIKDIAGFTYKKDGKDVKALESLSAEEGEKKIRSALEDKYKKAYNIKDISKLSADEQKKYKEWEDEQMKAGRSISVDAGDVSYHRMVTKGEKGEESVSYAKVSKEGTEEFTKSKTNNDIESLMKRLEPLILQIVQAIKGTA